MTKQLTKQLTPLQIPNGVTKPVNSPETTYRVIKTSNTQEGTQNS